MKQIWVEKHRPKTISDVIMMNSQYRNIFDSYVSEGVIPSIMLYGGPGTGKTSISLALVNDLQIDEMDVIKINCSSEKIDAVRSKIEKFAYTIPVGKFKVVRLEEFDRMGAIAQESLRDLIEDVSASCRFIATCNYVNLIPPAVRSRFTEFEIIKPDRDDVLVRMAEILEKEHIEFEIEDLEQIVESAYPDSRKIIQKLEAGSKTGKLTVIKTAAASDWKLELLTHLTNKDLAAARKSVCSSASKEELIDVYRFLYDNIHRCKLKNENQAIILIAQYQFQHNFVYDPELQIAALFIELSNL